MTTPIPFLISIAKSSNQCEEKADNQRHPYHFGWIAFFWIPQFSHCLETNIRRPWKRIETSNSVTDFSVSLISIYELIITDNMSSSGLPDRLSSGHKTSFLINSNYHSLASHPQSKEDLSIINFSKENLRNSYVATSLCAALLQPRDIYFYALNCK